KEHNWKVRESVWSLCILRSCHAALCARHSLSAFLKVLCQHANFQLRRFVSVRSSNSRRHDWNWAIIQHPPLTGSLHSVLTVDRNIHRGFCSLEKGHCIRHRLGHHIPRHILAADVLDGANIHTGVRSRPSLVSPRRGHSVSHRGTITSFPTADSYKDSASLSPGPCVDALFLRRASPSNQSNDARIPERRLHYNGKSERIVEY